MVPKLDDVAVLGAEMYGCRYTLFAAGMLSSLSARQNHISQGVNKVLFIFNLDCNSHDSRKGLGKENKVMKR